jgi:hypothetical protein
MLNLVAVLATNSRRTALLFVEIMVLAQLRGHVSLLHLNGL